MFQLEHFVGPILYVHIALNHGNHSVYLELGDGADKGMRAPRGNLASIGARSDLG